MGRLLQIAHHLLSEKGGGRPSNPLLFPPSPPFPAHPKRLRCCRRDGIYDGVMGLWPQERGGLLLLFLPLEASTAAGRGVFFGGAKGERGVIRVETGAAASPRRENIRNDA